MVVKSEQTLGPTIKLSEGCIWHPGHTLGGPAQAYSFAHVRLVFRTTVMLYCRWVYLVFKDPNRFTFRALPLCLRTMFSLLSVWFSLQQPFMPHHYRLSSQSERPNVHPLVHGLLLEMHYFKMV